MTQPAPPSPQNEKEAEVKAFLERGATTEMVVEDRFTAATVKRDALDPVTVTISGAASQRGRLKGAGGDKDAHITLRITHDADPDLAVLVFVNTPHADAGTATTEPGFVGAVAFFGHHEDSARSGTFRLPATAAMVKAKPSDAVTVTVVPVSAAGTPAAAQRFDVSATVDIITSTVK